MNTMESFISKLFSLVSFINTQYLRPLLSLYPRKNTITTAVVSQPIADNTRHFTVINIPEEQPASNTPDESPDAEEDELKKTRKVALTIALSIAAISAGLVINPLVPKSLHFLLTPYTFLVYGSLFVSVGLAIYSIKNNKCTNSEKSNNTARTVWVLRISVLLGIISIFLAVALRGLMVLSIN